MFNEREKNIYTLRNWWHLINYLIISETLIEKFTKKNQQNFLQNLHAVKKIIIFISN